MELMDCLREAQRFAQAQGYACAYLAVYGSQNYGLALDTAAYRSDLDVKCAVLPNLSMLAREESVPPATLEWQGGQIEIKDARRFAEVCAKRNPSYLETLLTPHYLAPSAAFESIRALAQPLLSDDPAAFLQACRGQGAMKRKNLCHPFPAAMEKIRRWGYDGKQAHHMYRLLLIMRRFEQTGRYALAAPEEEKAFLLALKRNEIPLCEAQRLTALWAQEMDEICARAGSPRGKAGPAGRSMKRLACEAVEAHVREELHSMI